MLNLRANASPSWMYPTHCLFPVYSSPVSFYFHPPSGVDG